VDVRQRKLSLHAEAPFSIYTMDRNNDLTYA
jgi:hypothetical protein